MSGRPSYPLFGRLISLAVLCGCSELKVPEEKQPPPAFEVLVATTDATGQGVSGAQISAGKTVLGTTDASGSARLKLTGDEGSIAELVVKCPAQFASPSKPITVGLRRLASGSPPPRFDARCTRLTHSVVAGVRAENGPNLPILYLGRPVGRTDGAGAAHVLLELGTNEQVVLTLDTSEKGGEFLRPQSPTMTFVTQDHDEVVLLEQKFTVLKKPVVVHRPPAKPMPL